MSTETGGGSRSLKSLHGLISTTMVLLVIDVLAWIAGWLLELDIVFIVAAVLALATAVPLFLMFKRVKAVEGDFGRLSIEVENVPSENPRTGRLSYLSAIAMLRELGAPLRVGT